MHIYFLIIGRSRKMLCAKKRYGRHTCVTFTNAYDTVCQPRVVVCVDQTQKCTAQKTQYDF